MLLIDYARSLGMSMGGLHNGRHCGMTSDPEKAQKLRDAGASVVDCTYASDDPLPQWTLEFAVGSEAYGVEYER